MCSDTHGHMLQEEMDLLSKAGRNLTCSTAVFPQIAPFPTQGLGNPN